MNYDNRRYLIIPASIKQQIDFSQVLETSIDTLRLSVDGTKTFVKYNITTEPVDRTETSTNPETGEEETVEIKAGTYGRPSIYSTQYTELTHSQIIALLATNEWTEPLAEQN